MDNFKKRFREIIKEKKLIDSTISLIHWDLETATPKKGQELLSEMIGYLSLKSYNLYNSEEFKELLKKLQENENSLSEIEKIELHEIQRELDSISKIPAEEYKEYSELTAKSQGIWEEAKLQNNFNLFQEYLEKIFAFNKKFIEYRGYEGHPYNTLLEDYERGMTVEKLDIFFKNLREAIVPLLKKIVSKNHTIKNNFTSEEIPIWRQKNLTNFLADYLGFDREKGVVGISEHPFTLDLDRNDVRITTKFIPTTPFSSVFSILHETGHALYEQGSGDELVGTILAGGSSMGIHESQSRFYENMVGRSLEFWEPLYEKLKEQYPHMKDIEIEEFYRGINMVEPSLIRTEADELTYCLHVMVRYEIEKALLEEKIKIADLPKIWNEKMKEYLGVEPASDAEGVLQDVHWSGGMIGYFPSYALGNAYAAQIYDTMRKELNIPEILRNGDLFLIKDWLEKKIYHYGKSKTPAEIILEVTGKNSIVNSI